MSDLGKMGIVGTKLFWQLFTNSIRCKGVGTERIEKNIENFKLFMYWARKSGHKLLIRKMFFDRPKITPFKLLEYMIEDPYMRNRQGRFRHTVIPEEWGFEPTDISWYLIFFTAIPKIEIVDGAIPKKLIEEYYDLDSDWKKFFKKAKNNLL